MHTRDRKTFGPNSNCLAGTRQGVLQSVRSWVDGEALPTFPVYWLCGPVGCGKSAVAQSICEEFHGKNRLAASFFFYRGTERENMSRFAATLAKQMEEAIPPTAPLVQTARSSPYFLERASPQVLLEKLVYQPFGATFSLSEPLQFLDNYDSLSKPFVRGMRKLSRRLLRMPRIPKRPYLIVIDGLDECSQTAEVQEFIDQLLDFFKKCPFTPLRFLITSRIEEHIRSHITKDPDLVHVVDLTDICPDDDITTLVLHEFGEAAKHNPVIRNYPGTWPSQEGLAKLMEHAGRSFIFIKTLLDYILEPNEDGSTPMVRLQRALGMHPGLDGLYTQTLNRSKNSPHFYNVISTIALSRQPMSISDLADLLDVPPFEIFNILLPLQAIIRVPGDDQHPVTFFHTSLRDFLTQEARSGPEALFASPTHHEYLARRCLHSRHKRPSVQRYAGDHWLDHYGACLEAPTRDPRQRTEYHLETFLLPMLPKPTSPTWSGFQALISLFNALVFEPNPGSLLGASLRADSCSRATPVPKELIKRAAGDISSSSKHFLPCFIKLAERSPFDLQLVLQRHLLTTHPSLFEAHSIHTDLVLSGLQFFLQEGQSTPTHSYMLLHWCHHLAKAVEGEPSVSLEFLRANRATTYSLSVLESPDRYLNHALWVQSDSTFRSGVEAAINSIRDKVSTCNPDLNFLGR
jgi:hypothetical protein